MILCKFCSVLLVLTVHGQDLVTAAGHGSKLYPRAAGHMQFAQLPAWEQGPANLACLANASVTSLEVIQDVAALMVSWFDQELTKARATDVFAAQQQAAALLGEQ